jgi:hypothetical protein
MIPNPAGTPRVQYFAHFKDTGTMNFLTRVFVAPQGATFSFGLAHFSSTMQVQWPTALNYGQWYTVAIRYNGANDTSTLWVNPVDPLWQAQSISCTSVIGIYTNPASIPLSAFALRQSSAGTGGVTWKWDVDNIEVGTTFQGVCPQPTPTRGTTWGQVKAIYR